MTRYFFDLAEHGDLIEDEEGVELPDISAARRRAFKEARSIMMGDVTAGRLDLSARIIVRTEAGTVLEVGFDEVLEITHPPEDVDR